MCVPAHACLWVCEHVFPRAHVHVHMCTVLHVGQNSTCTGQNCKDSEFPQTTSPPFSFSCHNLIHLLSGHTDLHSLQADKSVLVKKLSFQRYDTNRTLQYVTSYNCLFHNFQVWPLYWWRTPGLIPVWPITHRNCNEHLYTGFYVWS